jgi:hypothetical protein
MAARQQVMALLVDFLSAEPSQMEVAGHKLQYCVLSLNGHCDAGDRPLDFALVPDEAFEMALRTIGCLAAMGHEPAAEVFEQLDPAYRRELI